MFDTAATWIKDNLDLIAFLLPLFIGFITKAALPERAKATIMLVVTAIASLIASTQTGAVLDGDTLQLWGKSVVITVASYYGVWKPVGLGNIAPAKGIGPSV